MHIDGVDEDDGRPLWSCVPGETLLGDHVALERLGVGTRCETWLCWSRVLWAPVVVKLARPHQVTHPRALRTLGREVAALDGVVHPTLPGLVADHRDHQVPHVATEYVDGDSLADLVDDGGTTSPLGAARLGVQLLSALAQLHRRGLAHLDVKPDNVVLRDGRPVLVDFGSVRRLGSPQPAGRPVGTLGYSAPEMEACEPIGAGMDLYGVGATLAEVLAGTPESSLADLPPGPTTDVVVRLLADDPVSRGTVASSLLALAACCEEPPWPTELDREVGALGLLLG